MDFTASNAIAADGLMPVRCIHCSRPMCPSRPPPGPRPGDTMRSTCCQEFWFLWHNVIAEQQKQ